MDRMLAGQEVQVAVLSRALEVLTRYECLPPPTLCKRPEPYLLLERVKEENIALICRVLYLRFGQSFSIEISAVHLLETDYPDSMDLMIIAQ